MSPHFERAIKFAESQQNGPEPRHDWTLSQMHALAFEFQRVHDLAIHSAAMKATEWGMEAGDHGDGYRNLAHAIDRLMVDK